MKSKKKPKNSRMNFLIWTAAVLAIITIAGLGFSVAGNLPFLPNYWTGECVARADNMQEMDLGKVPNEGKFYPCTTEASGKWIPEVAGVQCEFYTTESTSLNLDVYVCPEDATESNLKDKCTKVKGFFTDPNKARFVVNATRQLYVNPTSVFGLGSTKISAKYPSYGLRVRDAQGFVSETTTNCIANNINQVVGSKVHTLNLEDRIVIVPGAPLNIVTGLSQAISTQVVNLEDVAGGDLIYISRPGYYYKIKEAEDGFLYVDTAGGEFKDSDIECIPRTTGCSDEAKAVKLEDQSCDQYGGAITNYAPVQGDPNKLCKYSCKSGTLKLTSDCIAIQSECPEDKPLWDAATGKCVSIIDEKDKKTDISDILFWVVLIGAFLFCVIIILIIKVVRDQK